jgi:hypothetical protein
MIAAFALVESIDVQETGPVTSPFRGVGDQGSDVRSQARVNGTE